MKMMLERTCIELQCLTILAKSSIEEITKSTKSVDFWITDRAADCSALLENLGVEDEKTL